MSGLADRVGALVDEWEANEAYHCIKASECVRCVTYQYVVLALRRVMADADNSPRCHCGKYPVDPDHCLTLFDRDDTAVERHAVGACEGGGR